MDRVEVAVRFRILGPLEVDVDGAPVDVGGPKPRALLAVLLVHRGCVVSMDRLVDVLWGERPPPGATSALRAYLSRLRAALGGQARLRYRAPGYVLAAAVAMNAGTPSANRPCSTPWSARR